MWAAPYKEAADNFVAMLAAAALVLTFVGSLGTQAQHLLGSTGAVSVVVVSALLLIAGTVVFVATLAVFLLDARGTMAAKPRVTNVVPAVESSVAGPTSTSAALIEQNEAGNVEQAAEPEAFDAADGVGVGAADAESGASGAAASASTASGSLSAPLLPSASSSSSIQ